ncbi:MAG TPA: hypothetical protein VK452_05870 [Dissulfurispiraceae bacterium]|nr:hypothetical protein [Dissulfurispiraceae bacterium]
MSDNVTGVSQSIRERASSYRKIIGALMDMLESGIHCLKNIEIKHNKGRHSVLIRDLSMDKAIGTLIQAVTDRFRRLKNIDITVSREDVPRHERFNYSYIIVVRDGEVKSELP